MKKRLVTIGVLVLAMAAFTGVLLGCGANGSAESAAKAYAEGFVTFNSDKWMDSLYITDEDAKKEAKAIFDSAYAAGYTFFYGTEGTVKITTSNVKYEQISTVTEDNLKKYEKLYDKPVHAGETGKVTYDYTIKGKGKSVIGIETDYDETKSSSMNVMTLNIDGKWYALFGL